MTWEIGEQNVNRGKPSSDLWEEFSKLEGLIDEDEAALWLVKLLQSDPTFASQTILGLEIFPFQHITLQTLFKTDYPLMIFGRGSGKTWICAVFVLLYALFNQGIKIGILSATFRQSRMIFSKMDDILNSKKAAIIRQIVHPKLNTSRRSEEWRMDIGASSAYALPLGGGEKLRGYRFNLILIDEFLLMPQKIHKEVIMPFLSTVPNPTERKNLKAAEDELIESGIMKEEDRHVWSNNKLVALSSASFKFEYLYEVYSLYEKLIYGNIPEDLKEMLGDAKNPASSSILHFSYEIIPEDMYDASSIAQAKASMSVSQFDREFRSKFTDDSSGYYSMKTMLGVTVPEGEYPCVEISGEKGHDYILAFDPNWSESETADDFAMQVGKINYDKGIITLVHSYAVAGKKPKEIMDYFLYLLESFNIVFIVGDYNGGVSFINTCNESKLFKDKKLKIGVFAKEIDHPESYNKDLQDLKQEYTTERVSNNLHCCMLRKPTNQWIVMANAELQSAFDHKRLWFASEPFGSDLDSQTSKNVDVSHLRFLRDEEDEMYSSGVEESEKGKMSKIDLVENTHKMIILTKAECAMIEVTASAQGTMRFDLPQSMKRQKGKMRPRKDSYSALVLLYWGFKIYMDMRKEKADDVQATFTPFFV